MAEHGEVICLLRIQSDVIYIERLASFGIQVMVGHQSEQLQEIGKIDVIIYDKYYTYYDESHLRKYWPHAKLIIDSVDVHWVREERSLPFNKHMTQSRVTANKN